MFGKSTGEQPQGDVTAYFAAKGRRSALETAVTTAFPQVESTHPVVVQQYGFDTGFVRHEASAELARVLIPGESPDAGALAEVLVASWAPSDASTRIKLLTEAHGPATLFVERLQYLKVVYDEHCWLNTAGTGHVQRHRRIPLESVYVSLSAVENVNPLDQSDRFFTAEVQQLEAALAAGTLSTVAYEGRTGAYVDEKTCLYVRSAR